MQSILILSVIISTLVQAQRPWQSEMLQYVNEERSKAGVQTLCLNDKLNQAASAYSKTLEPLKVLDHFADGDLGSRLKRVNYEFTKSGENLASEMSPKEAFDALMKSPPHKENLLGPDFKMMGLGGTTDGDKHTGIWVQVFAQSSSEGCSIGGGGGAAPAGGSAPTGAPPAADGSSPAGGSSPSGSPSSGSPASPSSSPSSGSPASPSSSPSSGSPPPSSGSPSSGSPSSGGSGASAEAAASSKSSGGSSKASASSSASGSGSSKASAKSEASSSGGSSSSQASASASSSSK